MEKNKDCDYAFQVIMLVGRRGNLSLALQQICQETEIQIIGSDIAQKWTVNGGERLIEKDLEDLRIKPDLIINAAGEINPSAGYSRLRGINYHLPRNLEKYSRHRGIKLVTFGTIMENFKELSNCNPYLWSKFEFYDYLTKEIESNVNLLHLQIHTWYGVANPNPGMFLGQILRALLMKEEFKMSSGNQLREYHNIYDDLSAMQYLISQNTTGIVQVNHGEALPLREIATTVFNSFSALNLLKIGSLDTSKLEIMAKQFEPNKLLAPVKFCATMPGIIGDFNRLLEGQQ